MFNKKDLRKSKISQWEYIFKYCIPTGFQSMRHAFINWMDLVWFVDNHKHYAFLSDDDPFEECRLYFWGELQEDVYSKEFIEHLYELAEQVDRCEVELFPFTQEMLDRIEDLVGDVEDT